MQGAFRIYPWIMSTNQKLRRKVSVESYLMACWSSFPPSQMTFEFLVKIVTLEEYSSPSLESSFTIHSHLHQQMFHHFWNTSSSLLGSYWLSHSPKLCNKTSGKGYLKRSMHLSSSKP